MSIVSCKWVFSVKYGTDGRPERFKARLVARGFTQQFGVDYENTFAPVIRFDSLRILLALAARYGWIVHLMDAQVRYHAIRDFVEQGEIQLQYIPTDAMLADGLTKALDRVKFERMIKGLGLTN